VRNYKDQLEGHVLPALGHLKVRELHRGHIKAFLAQKRGQGCAKNTVRLMRAPLSTMLSDAADDGIIMANPAFQVGRRKTNRADKLTAAERIQKIRPMTWEQRDAFLAAEAAEPRYATLFSLLAKTGMRPGEAFALKPGDIDWGERTVRVERAWNLGRVKSTKTYEERTVDLTPELVEACPARDLAEGRGPSSSSRTRRGSPTTRRGSGRCSSARSGRRSCPPSASTISATLSRRCSSRSGRPSPT
jgi:integrase